MASPSLLGKLTGAWASIISPSFSGENFPTQMEKVPRQTIFPDSFAPFHFGFLTSTFPVFCFPNSLRQVEMIRHDKSSTLPRLGTYSACLTGDSICLQSGGRHWKRQSQFSKHVAFLLFPQTIPNLPTTGITSGQALHSSGSLTTSIGCMTLRESLTALFVKSSHGDLFRQPVQLELLDPASP